MNSDPDLDELLRRYRPAGPPPELRARVLRAEPMNRPAWPWAAAAAILLATICAMHVSTRRVYDDVRRGLVATDVTLDQLPALSFAVGDDRLLRERIETDLRLERSGSAAPPAEPPQSW